MLIDFRELFPRYNINPKGVLHIGGNTGEEAPIYLQLGIKKQIWVEANYDICQRLRVNISNNPQASALCFAASDADGVTILHISNNGSQSSSILPLGTHKNMHPDVHYVKDAVVEMARLDTALKDVDLSDFDFLNMDIQGAELKALKGLGELIHGFKWIYLEVNSDYVYEGCALLPEIEEFLKPFGFRRAELKWASANLTWGDCLFIK